KVYNDLHLLKQAESWKSIAINNIQVFLQSHLGQQQLGPQFIPIPFPKVAPRPPGGNFRPPQSSQVHTTPGPRSQCVPVSAAASFPTIAQGSQVHASPAASVAAPSIDQASAPLAPFPLAVQAENFLTSVKKTSSAQEKGSFKAPASSASDMQKEKEERIKKLLDAACIKPLPPDLEPYASKPASPKPKPQEKPPSPPAHVSDVEILPPQQVLCPPPLSVVPPPAPQVFEPVVLPPSAAKKDTPQSYKR
ncbi:hypothetical protein U1Q18_037643, partial [Sarracenia purpurea var. burkii]